MTQDFSGQNLRGRNFKGQNLTGANFSGADIRGANFNSAILIGANFTKATAGLQRRWAFGLVTFSLVLSPIIGFFSVFAGVLVAAFFTSAMAKGYTIIPGAITLIVLAVFFIVTIRQGLEAGAGAAAGAAAGAVAGAAAVSAALAGAGARAGAAAVAMAMAGALAGAGAGAVVLAGALAAAVALAGAGAAALALAVAGAGALAGEGVAAVAGAGAVVEAVGGAVAVAVVLLSFYVARRALTGDEKNAFVRKIALFFAAMGGTSFRNANLTDADFMQATLKCTKFIGANLTRTRFYEAKKLLLARVGKSILDPLPIRTLLVTGKGRNKSYIGANLRGANLIGADLCGANLKGANITDATFQGANLETANLTLTEAIGTDFTSSQMTGACVEAWNIESNTKLDNVDCRFIYLLEDPKPRTDDRERRPSSGEFAPGAFTKLFQEVLTTVDLIFRNGVDWKAFTAAFQKVQVENEDTELTIQSIENKGDGVVVVRVSVPPDTNKAKIHSEFTQNYDLALKAIEEKYQAKIESKDEQITLYRQQLEDSRQREIRQNSNMEKIIDILANTAVNVPVNEREVKAIADHQTAVNLVILTLGTGDFNKGFPSVTAQIWTEGDRLPIQPNPGELLSAPEIVEVYHLWQSQYNRFIDPLKSSRMERKQSNVTNFSKIDLDKLAEELEEKLNKWLNAEQFLPIDRILRERFNRSDEIQVIIQSENIDVRRLPWHLWDFLKPYRKAEIALSSPFYDRTLKTSITRNQIRILSILGDDKGIDIDKDRQLLDKFDAEKAFIVKPNSQELEAQLWSEQGWDILCFSGHSSSEMDGSNGYIYINDTEKITIPELKNALTTAIERGLQIAIFNSCDGLGLANQLAALHIPQIIVMREPVPDRVAQEFLKHFLTAFASGKSFYLSVREAREKLQSLEEYFPCASWLPIICQNPAEIPPTWESLRRSL